MSDSPANKWRIAREIFRWALLLVTIMSAFDTAKLSQSSSQNHPAMVAMVSNSLIFYLMLVAFQLWIFRLRGWKILLATTLVLSAFIAEFLVRVSGS